MMAAGRLNFGYPVPNGPLIFGDPGSIRIRDIGREVALRQVVYCPTNGCNTRGNDLDEGGPWLVVVSFGVEIVAWACRHCERKFRTDLNGSMIDEDAP